ncbi:hypothetical protein [Dysgonomonas sp. 520]|uniref:hypothetical protein n=1 Tax=Dysgonomonas sp. 520 TaxID=2302931 RepID=UPI0013D613AF|nr:hypothetical protein [Dysgonomonas sp. 520]NDW08527.1 hypothetical protein [Dysgonomonas sp. 520]
MKKLYLSLVSLCVLVSSLSALSNLKLEPLWEFSLNKNGVPSYMVPYVWNMSQRSMAVHNDVLYINNMGNGNIAKVNTADGTTLGDVTTTLIANPNFWYKNCIAITDDGEAILGSSGTGSTYFIFTSCDLATASTTSLGNVTVNGMGRSDYFDIYGNRNTAEGGYIAFASNSNKVGYIPMANGVFGTPVLSGQIDAAVSSLTSALAIVKDENSFFYVFQNPKPKLFNKTDFTFVEMAGVDAAPSGTNSGGAYFKFKGKEYLIIAHGSFGAIRILDITAGLNKAEEVFITDDLGNSDKGKSPAITPICVDVQADHVKIFAMAAENGIVAYKFQDNSTVGMDDETSQAAYAYANNGILTVKANGGEKITVSDLSGRILYTGIASEAVTEISDINSGQIVIVRIGEVASKVKL